MDKKLKTALKIIAILFLCGIFIVVVYFISSYSAIKDLAKTYEEQENKEISSLCEPVNNAELGSPYLYYGIETPGAEFTTDGSAIYISAQHMGGTSLDTAFNPITIYIGSISDFSENEFRRDIENSDLVRKIIINQKYSKEILVPPGRYRLWATYSKNIVIYSCEEGGVSDPKPVWR